MSLEYKILGQGAMSSTPQAYYIVPVGKQAVVSSVYLANNSSSSETYSLAIVPNGESASTVHYIRSSITLASNDFHVINTKLTLSAGDSVVINGSSSLVSINIFGVEK